jgi:hypothetical protein
MIKSYTEISFEKFEEYFKLYTKSCPTGKFSGKRLCPYHIEKTGSAHIINNTYKTPRFYCFGCHHSANIIQFLTQVGGLSLGDAYKELGIKWSGIEGRSSTQQQYLKEKKLKDVIQGLFPALKNSTLQEKDIYFYDVPEDENFIPYYKAVFRNRMGGKDCRFCHFDSQGKLLNTAPESQVPYNYIEALQWNLEFRTARVNSNKFYRKLIITEGEKDVETIKQHLQYHQDDIYTPISLKGLGKKEMKEFMEKILSLNGDDNQGLYIESVYFIGDNDDAGDTYLEDCYDACKEYVKHFWVVNLSRIAEKMPDGYDITDWHNQFVKEGALELDSKTPWQIRRQASETFALLINNHHKLHDYCLSQYWASVEIKVMKDKVIYTPNFSWVNIESFFRANKCKFKKEEISGKIFGDFGFLKGIQDRNNRTDQVNYIVLKTELETPIYDRGKQMQGMPIKNTQLLQDHFNTYVNKRSFIDMLDKIDKTPKRFVLNNTYIFEHEDKSSSYKVPELLYFLLESIVFSTNDAKKVLFQKLLILKTLLMLPHVLRNNFESKIALKGDLRLIGANGIGKTDFVRHLFGDGYNISSADWYFKMPYLDVLKNDDKKMAFSAPCLFLDEGNIGGKPSEQRAFMDGSYISYIEKYQTHTTAVIRRSIIISSSNYKEVSYDITAERRMWAVEIKELPHLIRLSCEKYYVTSEQRKFWDNYIAKEDFFEIGEEKYFKFPVLEFWQQMNSLFKENREIIDEIVSMKKHELEFYRNEWMTDKYALNELQRKITALHDWKGSDNIIKIPNLHFSIIEEFYFGKYEGNANALTRNYRTIINAMGRVDECSLENIDNRMYVEGNRGNKLRSRYRLLPKLQPDEAKVISNRMRDSKREFDFDIMQYAMKDELNMEKIANDSDAIDNEFQDDGWNYLPKERRMLLKKWHGSQK